MDQRDTIIDAMMRLLADRPFEEVTLRAIADEAGVSLAELNRHFPTRGHIVRAFSRRIDGEVLALDTSDMADQPPRDRLFDVLMSRLDALKPYRAGVGELLRAGRRDPALALGLDMIAVESGQWMLAAAGISAPGWRGRVVLQGLAVALARVLRVFVTEEDPGLPRTMAALDRELREAERRHARFSRMFGRAVHEDRPTARPAFEDAAPPAPEPAPVREPEPEPEPEPGPEAAPEVAASQPTNGEARPARRAPRRSRSEAGATTPRPTRSRRPPRSS